MEKCRRMKRPQFCHRIVFFVDCKSPRGYVRSLVARKALRWTWIPIWVDQRSKNHISLKKGFEHSVTWKLRTNRGSWLVIELFLQFSSFNINDIFKTGEWSSNIFLKLTIHNCVKWKWDSSTRRSEWDRFPSSTCVKSKCWRDRTWRPVVFRYTGMAARIQRKSCGWQSSWTRRLTRQFFSWKIFRGPCLREVWIWVNMVHTLTSLKTEIARSVRGPKLQGPRAEDSLAEP